MFRDLEILLPFGLPAVWLLPLDQVVTKSLFADSVDTETPRREPNSTSLCRCTSQEPNSGFQTQLLVLSKLKMSIELFLRVMMSWAQKIQMVTRKVL